MHPSLHVRDENSRTAELLLQIPWQNTCLRSLPRGPRQDSAEPGQDRHRRLERCKLLGCEWRVSGQMTPDQGGDIGRVLHAPLGRSLPDCEPISRPQTDRDPVDGGIAARCAWRQIAYIRIEQCANGDQSQSRLRYAQLRSNLGEPTLLLRRRTCRDRWSGRIESAVVHCARTHAAADRGHFAILPSLRLHSAFTPIPTR